jgi:choline monooxygenase
MLNVTEGILSSNETEELLASLDAGYALPSHWYTDQALFAAEREVVLRRSWHFGAHTGQLAKPGDEALCEVAGVPIVLTRATDGEVHGFVNICRHRAHPVVLEPGNRQTMQCLYHGWTYNLDGCLRRAPRAEDELEFDASQFGLVPVQTAVWGPTVWVNVDASGPSFWEWIGELPQRVVEHGLAMDDYSFGFERRWEIDANWKVFLDNAIECYHCPTCHPSLSQVLEMDPELTELTVGTRHWTNSKAPIRSEKTDRYRRGDEDADDVFYNFNWIFPATYFQYVASPSGALSFDIGTVDVQAVDKIVLRSLIFWNKDADETWRSERTARADADPTVSEDVAICNRVQAAHAAGASSPGRLLPRTEWLLQHFQRVLVETMADAA